nr:atherin-like [Aegilops tauschii subsp. strangulata]
MGVPLICLTAPSSNSSLPLLVTNTTGDRGRGAELKEGRPLASFASRLAVRLPRARLAGKPRPTPCPPRPATELLDPDARIKPASRLPASPRACSAAFARSPASQCLPRRRPAPAFAVPPPHALAYSVAAAAARRQARACSATILRPAPAGKPMLSAPPSRARSCSAAVPHPQLQRLSPPPTGEISLQGRRPAPSPPPPFP